MARLVGVLMMVTMTVALADDNELKDYCSMHRFENLPGGLRFTKEVVSTEYANVGAFKAIHCCLRGYRSIEWSVSTARSLLVFFFFFLAKSER